MISHWIFAACAVGGLLLTVWAGIILAAYNVSTAVLPMPQPEGCVRVGPYRFLNHPMYLGETFMIAGMAGLAAGWWNFWAALFIMNLLTKEWAWREEHGS